MSEVASTLPTLLLEYQALERELVASAGELTPELEAQLTVTETALRQKADAYIFIQERLENDEVYFKAKADEFSAIAKRFKAARERLKKNVKDLMRTLDVKEIKGNDFRFVLKNSNPTLVIEDAKSLPEECLVTTVETKPDNDRIKAMLKEGFTVPGAKLEPGYSLQSYPVKGER